MRFRKSILLAMVVFVMLTIASSVSAQIGISVSFGPPALPVYEQPLCPGEGYIWTPGYWAWDGDDADYYWVPGTWVLAPEVGYLWTPPWWGWEGGGFLFHEGYWGPQVGFYGGISYGFGYFGHGYEGGRWDHNRFFYNREVNNINVTNIRNVYNERVTINNENRVSYNGHGGVDARPTSQEEAAGRERHIPPVPLQHDHMQAARSDTQLRASVNHGKPAVAATARPGAMREGAVAARAPGGEYHAPENRGGGRPATAEGRNGSPIHPKDLPPIERSTGTDSRYQQRQDKLIAKQNKERDNLQRKQDQEHAKMERQKAPPERQQKVEQKHQQQTQQMSQRHSQQMQSFSASHGGGGKPK